MLNKLISNLQKRAEQTIAEQYNLPANFLEKFPRIEWFRKNKIMPYLLKNNTLYVAITKPGDDILLDDLRAGLSSAKISSGIKVKSIIKPEDEIINAVQTILFSDNSNVTEMLKENELALASSNSAVLAYKIDEKEEALVPRIVNSIIAQALAERASDIHFQSEGEQLKIRYRIDGVLHDKFLNQKVNIKAFINRIKIMANLNIAEDRLPQDGQIQVKQGKDITDIRVSTFSGKNGEHVTLRLLSKTAMSFSLDALGMDKATQKKFMDIISKNNGLVLLTGPTGSGKTSTLYSALKIRNEEGINILTIEDPVEYQMNGITQMQVNPKIGLTFADGLRSALRNDPEIIMVGEIRDLETAETAIHSAMTGHLVFSTLHTNDAAGGIARLLDLGIAAFLVTSSVNAFMAQRLARVICPHCKEEYTASKEELDFIAEKLGQPLPKNTKGKKIKLARGKGCPKCSDTGYLGRIGIFELLTISPKIKKLILSNADAGEIKAAAMAEGMLTLQEDAINKLLRGIITIEEIIRII